MECTVDATVAKMSNCLSAEVLIVDVVGRRAT